MVRDAEADGPEKSMSHPRDAFMLKPEASQKKVKQQQRRGKCWELVS